MMEDKTKKNPSVSVLVPIYNVEKYLRQCLDSIIIQTLRDLEIILINDGSNDSSLSIIKEYAEKDSRITILNKTNSGYGDSMNRGLEMAHGEYIGIVEPDDWIEPDMFKKLYYHAVKDQLDIVRSEFFNYSTGAIKRDFKTNTHFVPHNVVLSPKDETSIFMQQPSIWANLYSHSFLIENNIKFLPTPGASYQDTSFTFKVYSCANRFKMIDEAYYHYRSNCGSSTSLNNSKIYCICDEYREIWNFVNENGLYEQYKFTVSSMQFNAYKWNYNRLITPYAEEFFQKWHDEFQVLEENNEIDHNKFNRSNKKILDNVLSGICQKKDKPYVSIVVPVYNTEKYLRKCLDSLISQSLTNIEIICVNDGSTDGSRQILSDYEKEDSRIIIIDNPRGGPSSARNTGIKIAKADYIGFVDSDDWVDYDTFETAYYLASDSDIICFGTNVTGNVFLNHRSADNEYYRIKYEGKKILTNEIRLNVDVSVWNKLFSRKVIKDNDLEFPIGMFYEDYSFYWKYIMFCKTAMFIKDKKYNYLRREGSTMASTFNGNKRALDHLSIFPGIANFYREKNIPNTTDLLNSIFINCFWFAYLNVPLRMKKKVIKEANKIANQFNLSSEGIIGNIRRLEYSQIDKRKTYSVMYRFLLMIANKTEGMIGGDFSSIKKLLFGTCKNSRDCSNSVATTEWVVNHEKTYGIEHWSVIYDCNSKDSCIDWNTEETDNDYVIDVPKKYYAIFNRGHELKIHVSIHDLEVIVLQCPIINTDRVICGTTIFDGSNTINVSVELFNSLRKIHVLANNSRTDENYSKWCKILKIESK